MKLSREHRRIHLTFYLRVFQGDDFLGFCIDISPKGIMLISESPLQAEALYDLRMRIPPNSAAYNTGGVVEFSALCKWTHPDETNPLFHMNGLEIVNLQDEFITSLKRIIKDYKLP